MNCYSQKSGEFTPPLGWSTQGYSGFGDGKNNPAMENAEGVGPIPRGKYHAVQQYNMHPDLGAYVLRLQPDEETSRRILAMGRDPQSFFVHGDSKDHPGEASHGCLILPVNVRVFVWTRAPWIEVV